MTETEVRDELIGIQYMIEIVQNRFIKLINEDCVNPKFRDRIHKADSCLDEALDQMHFAKHTIEFIISSKIHQ